MARARKTKIHGKSATAGSAEKLRSLRGIKTELVDLHSSDTLAILAFLQIYHAADLIVKSVERDLARRNLTVARYAILRMLAGREPVTLGWVAEKHFSRMSNITAMIDRLVRDGLVQRLSDKDDRRVVRVKITAAGEKLIAMTRGPHREFVAHTMGPLSDKELRTLIELLAKLSEPLEVGVASGNREPLADS